MYEDFQFPVPHIGRFEVTTHSMPTTSKKLDRLENKQIIFGSVKEGRAKGKPLPPRYEKVNTGGSWLTRAETHGGNCTRNQCREKKT